MRIRIVVVVVLVVLLVGLYVGTVGHEPTLRPIPTVAVATNVGTGPDSPAFVVPPPAPLSWAHCESGAECATLSVPLDYSHPDAGTIGLFVKRVPAKSTTKRIGSLLVNPGGPGIPGTTLVAAENFSDTIAARFDIVGWDPRGTGRSSRVECVDDMDPYEGALDPTPDTPDERQLVIDRTKQFVAACQARSGALLPFVSTADSARDMEQIRRALGEQTITYFGFSYGSELGATYATLFPKSVRAMVIDGAEDPNATYEQGDLQDVVASERVLDKLLGQCAADAKCPFNNGGNAPGAFDKLWADLDAHPLVVKGAPGRPAVGQGVMAWAIVEALYQHESWPYLEAAFAAAQNGDGKPLLSLYDEYFRRGDATYAHAVDAQDAIDCLTYDGPTDLAALDQLAAEAKAVAPRLGGQAFYTCALWPVHQAPVPVTGKGAGPIVVIGTTGDPVTPIEASTNMAKALEGGVLVTAQADQHTGYSTSTCIDDLVDRYLVDKVVPPAGTVCVPTP